MSWILIWVLVIMGVPSLFMWLMDTVLGLIPKESFKKNPEIRGMAIMWQVESLFALGAGVYLYGWLRGILIYSALSSLLHICLLLKEVIRRLPAK